jgi:hypothetical protein
MHFNDWIGFAINRHFPHDTRPATIAGHSVLLTNNRINSGSAGKPFLGSKTGFLTPREMASALDRLQRR